MAISATKEYGSITADSVYRIASAVVPLYVAIAVGYFAVKCKFFTPTDIAGINRFVVLFAIPILALRFIAEIDFYTISYRLILADTVFKVVVFLGLAIYGMARRHVADLGWLITVWMLSTVSNTLIVGVPILTAMYGPMALSLAGQIVVGQAVLWYPGLMILYEFRAAHAAAKKERPPELAADKSQAAADLEMGITSPKITPSDDVRDKPAAPEVQDCRTSEKTAVDEGIPVQNLGNNSKTPETPPLPSPPSLPELVSSQAPKSPAVLRGQLSLLVRKWRPELDGKGSTGSGEQTDWRRTWGILGYKLRMSFSVHAAVLGLVYSLIAYKSGFGLPLIVHNSLDIIANTGIGMSMFSLGMFIASTSIFPCGFWQSLGIHGLRFVVGPALMGIVSFALGLRGDLLRVAIIQAALPQGIVPFSYAKEYNAYPEILSTAITFGTLVSFPVALVYYVVMARV